MKPHMHNTEGEVMSLASTHSRWKLPRYSSTIVQVYIVGFILFLNPGMYNALAGLGGSGQVDATVQNQAALALHCSFAVLGLVAGVVCNYLGIKWTMALGGLGYSMYSASFWCYNHTQNSGFVVFSGFVLGVCAAFLWTAQGAVMMSYPVETQKGKYIAICWLVFNLGSVIGSAIPLGLNWNNPASTVSDATYVAFLVLELCGAALCFGLVKTERVIRVDGTKVLNVVHGSVWSEAKGLYTTIVTDPWIIVLFPMFFASNFFYTPQFNDYNSYYFDLRTRSLNNLLYWSAQIIGAYLLAFILDWTRYTRRQRAVGAWIFMFVIVNVIWGGGLPFWLKINRNEPSPRQDLYDPGYVANLFLYIFYGFLDAFWQVYVYWLMGSVSNNPKTLALYSGLYKSIQAVGAAVISAMDSRKVPFIANFASCWALMGGSLLIALPFLLRRVKNTEMTQEDIAFVEGIGPMGVMGNSTAGAELKNDLEQPDPDLKV